MAPSDSPQQAVDAAFRAAARGKALLQVLSGEHSVEDRARVLAGLHQELAVVLRVLDPFASGQSAPGGSPPVTLVQGELFDPQT